MDTVHRSNDSFDFPKEKDPSSFSFPCEKISSSEKETSVPVETSTEQRESSTVLETSPVILPNLTLVMPKPVDNIEQSQQDSQELSNGHDERPKAPPVSSFKPFGEVVQQSEEMPDTVPIQHNAGKNEKSPVKIIEAETNNCNEKLENITDQKDENDHKSHEERKEEEESMGETQDMFATQQVDHESSTPSQILEVKKKEESEESSKEKVKNESSLESSQDSFQLTYEKSPKKSNMEIDKTEQESENKAESQDFSQSLNFHLSESQFVEPDSKENGNVIENDRTQTLEENKETTNSGKPEEQKDEKHDSVDSNDHPSEVEDQMDKENEETHAVDCEVLDENPAKEEAEKEVKPPETPAVSEVEPMEVDEPESKKSDDSVDKSTCDGADSETKVTKGSEKSTLEEEEIEAEDPLPPEKEQETEQKEIEKSEEKDATPEVTEELPSKEEKEEVEEERVNQEESKIVEHESSCCPCVEEYEKKVKSIKENLLNASLEVNSYINTKTKNIKKLQTCLSLLKEIDSRIGGKPFVLTGEENESEPEEGAIEEAKATPKRRGREPKPQKKAETTPGKKEVTSRTSTPRKATPKKSTRKSSTSSTENITKNNLVSGRRSRGRPLKNSAEEKPEKSPKKPVERETPSGGRKSTEHAKAKGQTETPRTPDTATPSRSSVKRRSSSTSKSTSPPAKRRLSARKSAKK